MYFEFGLTKNYTSTLTRVVGPTTRTGVRGTLPQPTPNDVNSVWLAKNGSDANPGTQALPKLTLAGAVAALTGAKPTIHIFRNGYVGELVFTHVGSVVVALGLGVPQLQVEDGEYAVIEASGAAGSTVLQGARVNGIWFRSNGTTGGPISVVSLTTGVIAGNELTNCRVDNYDYATNGAAYLLDSGLTTNIYLSLKYSILNCRATGIRCSSHSTNAFNNNIFLLQSYYDTSIVGAVTEGILFAVQNGVTRTTTFTRNLWINVGFSETRAIRDINANALAAVSTYNFVSCHFAGLTDIINVVSSGTNTNFMTTTYNFCLNAGDAPEFSSTLTLDTGFVATVTNAFATDTLPYFTNYLKAATLAAVADLEGFRLQIEGKETDTGARYLLSSPLFETGLSSLSVNPYDEDTAFTGYTFTDNVELFWNPRSAVRTRKLQNPIQATNVRGDLQRFYDSHRRQFTYQWSDYMNNDTGWKIELLMGDTGSIRFYRKGLNGNEYTNAVTGTWNSSTLEFTPTLPSSPLIPHKWCGYWLVFDSKHFMISDNDTTTFTLINPLSESLPANGVYSFAVPYILIKPDYQESSLNQDMYREDCGGDESERAPDDVVNYEYNGGQLVLVEVRSLDEDQSGGLR